MYGEHTYMKSFLILYSRQNKESNHYNWVVSDSVDAYTVFFMVLFTLTVDVKNWPKEFPEKMRPRMSESIWALFENQVQITESKII